MIPLPVAPLTGVTVLVTRPQPQAESLCARVVALGGEAIAFPVIVIEKRPVEMCAATFDWIIFVSASAVEHGVPHLPRNETTRFAAIGQATAAALSAREIHVDVAPENAFTSESLLAHPALASVAGQSVLIVKGEGGRELLHDALVARGARVTTLDVYRRVRPPIDPARIDLLEQTWRDAPIDIVTLTSVETLENLLTLLGDAGRTLLRVTPFVALSERIVAAARGHGLLGAHVLARGGDDDAIVGAIAAWHARAR